MSYIGTHKVGKLFFGEHKLGKAYFGGDLVYDSAGGGTPVLPYDAEVEYLQSSGTQYIDTGIKPTTNTRVVLECSNLLQSGDTENETFGYCATVNGSRVRFHMVAVAHWMNNKFHYGCGSGILYTTTADKAKHIFELSGDGSVIQDGVNYSIGSSITSISQTMPLFARILDGEYQYTTGVRVHSLKCYEDGVLILDFIPVRVGQVGYMYDKVSGQLFGNSGTGSFILGNDKQ